MQLSNTVTPSYLQCSTKDSCSTGPSAIMKHSACSPRLRNFYQVTDQSISRGALFIKIWETITMQFKTLNKQLRLTQPMQCPISTWECRDWDHDMCVTLKTISRRVCKGHRIVRFQRYRMALVAAMSQWRSIRKQSLSSMRQLQKSPTMSNSLRTEHSAFSIWKDMKRQ